MLNLIKETIIYVIQTLIHNAPSLILGIMLAAVIKVYIDSDKLKGALMRRANVSIPGSVAFGAFTPFCACGTMAVVLSMLTTALPWGPIMAFLTSSPLMSPDEFVMIAGIISPKFAIALTIASILIGLLSGYITHYIEKKSNFLYNQAKFSDEGTAGSCSCGSAESAACEETGDASIQCGIEAESAACGCCSSRDTEVNQKQGPVQRFKLDELFRTIVDVGLKKVLFFFTIFAAVGYLINKFVPASLITSLFSADNIFAVPLAAIIGLPLYVSGSSSIPIINALMAGGASGGSMLAFMITGPGTSAGVIAGIATIMKRKAIALYVGYILVGGILLGYLYDLFLQISNSN